MKNYNLSEQHVLDCDIDTAGDCMGGVNSVTNMFARDNGILDEACYQRDTIPTHGDCRQESPPDGIPQNQIKIAGYDIIYSPDPDELKIALINHGPLDVSISHYYGGTHSIVLAGYGTVHAYDTIWDQADSTVEHFIIVPPNSGYIGQLFWIFKNSWGTGYGDHGYFYHLKTNVSISNATYYILPFDDLLTPYDTIVPYDKDHDGYWNWGISEDYTLPDGACSDLEDSDDSENRIGPYQEDYSGKPIKPQMIVTAGPSNIPITNRGFYFMGNLDPQNIDIKISNPGNAQLNLAYLTPISIIDSGLLEFSLLGNQPESKICMGKSSSFKVQFSPNPQEQNHSALVKIQLHQCDNDIYEHFEFTILYGECNFNPEVYDVTGYELWDGYRLINQDIYIAGGATLEIK